MESLWPDTNHRTRESEFMTESIIFFPHLWFILCTDSLRTLQSRVQFVLQFYKDYVFLRVLQNQPEFFWGLSLSHCFFFFLHAKPINIFFLCFCLKSGHSYNGLLFCQEYNFFLCWIFVSKSEIFLYWFSNEVIFKKKTWTENIFGFDFRTIL